MAERHPLTRVVEVALTSRQRPPRGFPAVIEWASPVPFFGQAESARIASVGLNPSDREFCDPSDHPLRGPRQRLATLDSVGLSDWSGAGPAECSAVAEACSNYFNANPYNWFDHLEAILERAGRGTFRDGGACHIDLAPWATQQKWGRLNTAAKRALLECGRATFAALLSSARFEVLLLNGAQVVTGFERATGVTLPCEYVPEWNDDRNRRSRRWSAVLDSLGRVELDRPVTVLGWNWNLPESHITAHTRDSLAAWAAESLTQTVR